LSGKERSVIITSSSTLLPRLVALLCLGGALVVRDPARAWKALQGTLHSAANRAKAATKKKKVQPPPFLWTEAACATFDESTETHPKGTTNRWEAVAAVVGCTPTEAAARARDMQALQNLAAEDEANRQRAVHAAAAAAAQVEQDRAARVAGAKAEKEAKKRAKAKADAKAKAEADLEVFTTKSGWTDKEQKQLERGLKLFPSDDPRRWERIANFVSTRTKEECVTRYKAIVQALKLKSKAS